MSAEITGSRVFFGIGKFIKAFSVLAIDAHIGTTYLIDALIEHRRQQDGEKRLCGRDYQDNGLIFCQADGSYYHPDKVSARMSELALWSQGRQLYK